MTTLTSRPEIVLTFAFAAMMVFYISAASMLA